MIPRTALRLALPLLLGWGVGASCTYSFRAGSFPSHIRTIAVVPFENETERLELTQQLHDVLLQEVPRALGIQPGSEETADAVLRGRIVSYSVTAPAYRAATAGGDRTEVLQRQVTISVAVELVDMEMNQILWESRGLTGQGQFLEASESEDIGTRLAIDLIRQRILDGAQSTW